MAPILIGSLLNDKHHFILTELIMVHSMNRYVSEPHVFGFAIFIARFALYYDLDMTSNLALNLLIGLLVSKKFFSILPLLIFSKKIKIKLFSEFIQFPKNLPENIQILYAYIRMFIVNPDNFIFIPTFLWSLITGSSMKFLKSCIFLPSPPKGNIFWDFPGEKIDIKKRNIDLVVYLSYLKSIRENLYKIVKSGQFGIVDENSFYLFNNNKYLIMVHILSMNSFNIKFQIRCANINTKFNDINEYKTIDYIRRDLSLVTKQMELIGYDHVFYNCDFDSLTRKIKKTWISFAIISFFAKHKDEFFLSELFDFPFSDEDENEINKLDEDVFSLYETEFEYSSDRVFKFLNVIYREINRNPFQYFFVNIDKFKFTRYFPLFNNNDEDHDIEIEDEIISDELGLFEIEQVSQTESENEEENDLCLNKKNVKKLIKESGKRACLYLLLVSNNVAPDLNDLFEAREFIENVENDYLIIDEDSWENLIMAIKKNDNIEFENEQLDSKNIVSLIFNYGRYKFVQFSQIRDNWSVLKYNKEYVRSAWASACFCLFVYNNNYEPSNLIIAISDLPNQEIGYISGVEESIFDFSSFIDEYRCHNSTEDRLYIV